MDNKTTIKAGCILVNTKLQAVGLIYRENYGDFEFPKGHVENGESIEECAVRETAEETKRIAKIIPNIQPIISEYVTPRGENCKTHYFISTDEGKSDNLSADTHQLLWARFDKVEDYLTYPTLKKVWKEASKHIKKLLK